MKKFFKISFILILLAAFGYGGYFIYKNFYSKGEGKDAFAVVPSDAIFIVETQNLSEAWTVISKSKLWQHLIGTEYFSDINEDISMVDEYLKENEIADQLLSGRKLIMSAHMISPTDWDFLYTVDLQGAASTFNSLKKSINMIDGYKLETEKYLPKNENKKFEYYKFIDEASPKDIIYFTLINNLLCVSFNETIIKKVIEEKDTNYWDNNKRFKSAIAMAGANKLFKFYFNYSMLDDFSNTFLTERDVFIDMLAASLAYSVLNIDLRNEILYLEGYTNTDSISSYIKALANVRPGKMRAFDVVSKQTAIYLSINFDSYMDFYRNLIAEYEKGNPEEAQEIKDNIQLVEKLFNIDIEKDFFSWIGNEIALIKLKPSAQNKREEDIIIAIHANDIDMAKEGLSNITKQIRKRMPLKFDIQPYRNFEINYMQRKGFFGLFLGKLFEKMEKPYFTYIEDYVVMTNSLDLLKYTIDEYIAGKTLSHDPKFMDFKDEFNNKTNLALFIRMPKVYDLLYYYTPPKDRKDLEKNHDLILSFARLGFQLSSDGSGFDTKLIAEYDPDALVDEAIEQIETQAISDLSTNYFDSLEFKINLSDTTVDDGHFKKTYPDGKIKIEGVVKNGKPDGIWREYYPSGNLKNAVNYVDGKVDGIGYFYYDDEKNTKLAEVNFSNDMIQDWYKEYYPNGARKAVIEYKDGQRHGKAEFYYETGSLKIEGKYKKGQKNGKWKFYDENGEIISKEKWRKGKQKS